MRKFLGVGLGVAGVILAGWLYYVHVPAVPKPPKDLTQILPKQLLDRATPQQLATLRGDGSSASGPTPVAASSSTVRKDVSAVATTDKGGLKVSLTNDKHGALKGQAANPTDSPITYTYPAGSLFSNGTGDVILIGDFSAKVPAKETVDLSLPVAQTSVGKGTLDGNFAPRAGTTEALQPLVALLTHKKGVSPTVAQTAVLIVNDNAPLDLIASFPRLRPMSLPDNSEKPFCASPADLVVALALIKEAGIDLENFAIMSDPELRVMTMLDKSSHQAAMEYFGVTDQTQWAFWKDLLLSGDPSLRHYALYGIARYYPDVALQMLPNWVRATDLYRSYRLSAAWALALVEDKKAQDALKDLRPEMQSDAGMRQAIDRALQHWESNSQSVASNTVK